MGVNNGGVWKTDDYGRTWNPIFDDQPTGSIGDVAVAQSNPYTIYVASGEGIQRPDLSTGDGIYKSIDGGNCWKNIGLKECEQIGGLAVDPKNEDRVFVAAVGHPYGPNKERGVYRTLDGGTTWEKVLYVDENTGAMQVTIDPSNPEIVYADLWAARLAPWENGDWTGKECGLYKSVDGGTTWKKLEKGLPTAKDSLNRIGFCIAPSDGNRLYACVYAGVNGGGLYRSDDAGESWRKMSSDMRLWDRGDDFAEVKVDPKNEDIVYDANVVVWKSVDGGKTWTGWKGAPGGDDYHRLWINPANTNTILLAGDQGAAVTVNGGRTWSSWYNQPTAQLYHVSADNAFPYNVYSGQQESGSVGISSRGNDGAVTSRDWHPMALEEWGYAVADPEDANLIYGGKISRTDKRTMQSQDISPDAVHSDKYRFIRTAPIVFSPVDKKTLYFAGNVLFKTTDKGNSWTEISPDLTRKSYDVPECIGVYRNDSMKTMKPRGVIYTIAPSPLDINTIWVGTDDGLIQVTHDGGKNWENVTPPALTSWSKVSLMDASHTDKNCAYAAVNRIRLDDMHPHIYRTKDGGKTWMEIVNGLPNDPINVVKEDPERKGLLFAGSERFVNVSFDDGENWQPLRLNMPCTSIRDLIIKDNDLVVASHGRSFWILDDITPLRQITTPLIQQNAILYKPETAIRVRWDMWSDTPLPPDEPAGKNPPDGAVIDYYIKNKSNEAVTLNITDSAGKLVRSYSSTDTMYTIPDVNIPLYWIRPQVILSADTGSHRFLWDLHYKPLDLPPNYPISAIYGETAPAYTSPWMMPGRYNVILNVNGKSYTRPLNVVMDPRVKTSSSDLMQQFKLSYLCYENEGKVLKTIKQLNSLTEQIKLLKPKAMKELSGKLDTLNIRLDSLLNVNIEKGAKGFNYLNGTFQGLLGTLQGADVKPTDQCIKAITDVLLDYLSTSLRWELCKLSFINQINKQLQKEGLPELKVE